MKKIVLICFILSSFLIAETISKSAYSKLQKAETFIKNKQYSDAISILNPIVNSNENNMAKSYAYQSLANIYIARSLYKKSYQSKKEKRRMV